jgi:hypothetical protein
VHTPSSLDSDPHFAALNRHKLPWSTPVVVELPPEDAADVRRRFQERPERFADHTPAESAAAIGHNNPPVAIVDPGPDENFTLGGPLEIRLDRIDAEKLATFVSAIRSQGNNNTRPKAISNALHRARANPEISHGAYRFIEHVATRVRWAYRYCCETADAIGFFIGISDGGNLSRTIKGLGGVIASIDVPRPSGGRPLTFYTIACTPEDRTGQSLENLLKANSERERAVAKPQSEGMQDLKMRDCEKTQQNQSIPQSEELPGKTSNRGNAKPQNEGQTVYKDTVDTDSLSSAAADGVGATEDLLSGVAPPQDGAPNGKVPPAAKGDPCKSKKLTDAEIEASFVEWYQAYPRKEAPKDARRAYAKIIKSGEATPTQLLAAVRGYKFSDAPLKGEKDFRPHPATWLNGGRWQQVSAVASGDPVEAEFKAIVTNDPTLIGSLGEKRLREIAADAVKAKKGSADA